MVKLWSFSGVCGRIVVNIKLAEYRGPQFCGVKTKCSTLSTKRPIGYAGIKNRSPLKMKRTSVEYQPTLFSRTDSWKTLIEFGICGTSSLTPLTHQNAWSRCIDRVIYVLALLNKQYATLPIDGYAPLLLRNHYCTSRQLIL